MTHSTALKKNALTFHVYCRKTAKAYAQEVKGTQYKHCTTFMPTKLTSVCDVSTTWHRKGLETTAQWQNLTLGSTPALGSGRREKRQTRGPV